MKKVKYNNFITRDDIIKIILERFPDFKCPECGKNGVYAGCIEDQDDDEKQAFVILSFNVFCRDCGAVLGKWDNTNREPFLGKKE